MWQKRYEHISVQRTPSHIPVVLPHIQVIWHLLGYVLEITTRVCTHPEQGMYVNILPDQISFKVTCTCIATLSDLPKEFHNFAFQSEVKPQPTVACSHTFSWLSFASATCLRNDWLTGLFVSFVIQQREDFISVGFTTLNRLILIYINI